MATSKKTGGAKTTRSETVTVRLDPELRYLAEIASRIQRRTLSSYIEWAILASLNQVPIEDSPHQVPTVADLGRTLWDVDEADRFAKLGINAPHLLNFDEQKLWKLIRENGYLWRGKHYPSTGKWKWEVTESSLIYLRLREHWDAFKSVAYDGLDPEGVLPTWVDKAPTTPRPPINLADIDDDPVPF